LGFSSDNPLFDFSLIVATPENSVLNFSTTATSGVVSTEMTTGSSDFPTSTVVLAEQPVSHVIEGDPLVSGAKIGMFDDWLERPSLIYSSTDVGAAGVVAVNLA